MIYELRVYHCMPGRLPDLVKRFDTITLALWEKHGIRQAGFWTTLLDGYPMTRQGMAGKPSPLLRPWTPVEAGVALTERDGDCSMPEQCDAVELRPKRLTQSTAVIRRG